MLTINNISKSFNNKQILKDVSFSIDRGQVALLLGGSGAGKSTILRILNGLETFDSGTIMLDGKLLDVHAIHATHAIGMVFQQFNLFNHLTVEENITIALEKVLKKTPSQAHAIATQLLDRYGLAGKEKMPISSLSGGQKQRLAIARALALNPKIICLDEPTSALDPRLTKSVADHIKNLAAQGYCVIIATHDMALVNHVPGTVYLLDHGTIIETALSQELASNPDKFRHLRNFMNGLESELSQA